MSRIFDVAKKDKLIDLDEISELERGDGEAFQPASEERGLRCHAVMPVEKLSPAVRLRVSALAPLFPFDTGHPAAAEQYRIIRTKILHSPKRRQLVVVSSGSSGDGKTVTSINIAASLALKGDSRVLLMDGDLCNPRVSDALGLSGTPGLSEVLSGKSELEAALVRVEQFPNLFILPAGEVVENAAELLDSQRWRTLTEQVRTGFHNVICDAPPIATVANYDLLQLVCDGVIVVARPDHTNRAACAKALRSVPSDKLMGVVLNCVEDWWLWTTPEYGTYYPKRLG